MTDFIKKDNLQPTPAATKTNPVVRYFLLVSLMATVMQAYSADWWSMADAEFAKIYSKQAFGEKIEDQSMVAWMLFSRVNQQKNHKGKKFSKWELWPSNDDTFSPAVAKFVADKKIRTRPHLQAPKIFRSLSHKKLQAKVYDLKIEEEVTRNFLSYDYIMNSGLNSKAGVWKLLSTKGSKVDFPIGTVEIKGAWIATAVKGAYQITDPTSKITYSLLGLHIMAKMAPSPKNLFRSEKPSWFWTTFEFKGNTGLANAQTLITYKDKLNKAQANALLSKVGLSKTAFVNYVSNGTQIRYSDSKHKKIILGNTTMEGFAGLPDPKQPGKWTKWDSSCHTCHGLTSGNVNTTPKKFYAFPSAPFPTGKITDSKIEAYKTLDFVWSIYFHAR